MNLQQALTLKKGAPVNYPAGRDIAAGKGSVMDLGSKVFKAPCGTEFIWVTVRSENSYPALWPSLRLS